MKIYVLLIISLLFFLQLEGQSEKRIVILHTNDLHSRLTGYAPESSHTPPTVNDDSPTGGFARIAGIIKEERDKSNGSLLVLDAGDFFMGTLFPCLEPESGFQLRLMKKMGYDAAALGNHEFDFGPDWLAGVIRLSSSKGEIPSILAGNIEFDSKDKGDDSLEELYREKLIRRTLILERGGMRIGLFSVIGKEAAGFAPNAAPATFKNRISAAKNMVNELSKEKCDIIICISHSGVTKGKDGEWEGEDVQLAGKVKGITLIVGGHSHTRLDKPILVNGTPIVQTGAFGKFVGRLSVSVLNGKIRVDDYKLIPVDDRIIADRDINNLIEEQKQKISTEILNPLGLTYQKPVAEAGFSIECNSEGNLAESNLGPLVADAIYHEINFRSRPGTDVSMIAAGMLFDRIIPGIQTSPDIFRIVPLGSGKDKVPGYPLARLYITGKELKSVLEILQVAYKKTPDNYCYYSGIRVEYNPDKGFLRKIKKIDIVHSDGTLFNVDFDRKNKTLYSITADSYMLEFIGIIRKMSFGLINVVPKDINGQKIMDMKNIVIDMDENQPGVQEGKEWLTLIRYLETMKDVDGNGIPDIDKKYSSPLKCFFPVKGR